MKQKTSFYFVMYLVALVSLLEVMTERDEAQNEIIQILVQKISEPPQLEVPDTVIWFAKQESRSLVKVRGLENGSEKDGIAYELKPIDGDGPEGLNLPLKKDEEGNGIIAGNVPEKGIFRLQASAQLDRALPKDLPEAVRDIISRQLGDKIPLKSKPVNFTLRVEGAGAAPPKLTLNVEPPAADKWIVGSPYVKNIYVGGPPPDIVDFSVSDGRFRLVKDIGRVRLEWADPIVTTGPITVTVSGRAHRGAEPELENATTSFTVNITPPRWDPEPQVEAYWDVPFTFASGVRGLDPNKYSVEVRANGNPIKTLSAVEYPFVIKPERTWTSMTFRVLSIANTEMLKKEIPVKKPIPPQIRMVGSTWQGSDYLIKFTSVDVGNGDVTIESATVVQPEGITSRLDTRRGKAFTIIVQNLQATRPNAIKIKITVSGIGGPRTDQVTQAILY